MPAKMAIIIFSIFFSINILGPDNSRAQDLQREAGQVYQFTKAIGIFQGLKRYCSKIYSINNKWIDNFILSYSKEATQLIGKRRFEFIMRAEAYNTEIDVASGGAKAWCQKQRNLFKGRISERAIFR